MTYKTVAIFNQRKIDYLALTDAQLVAIEKDVQSAIAHNKHEYIDLTRQWNMMLDFVQSVWGKNSAAFKYWQSHKIPKPQDLATAYAQLIKKTADARRKKQQRDAQAQADLEAKRQRSEKAKVTRERNKAEREKQAQWEIDIQAD